MSNWLHFRKLPKKGDTLSTLPQVLRVICEPFGEVLKLVVLHGRGQALVQLKDHDACKHFIDSTKKQVIYEGWRQVAQVEFGQMRGELSSNENPSSTSSGTGGQGCCIGETDVIRREVERCLNSLIRKIVTYDSHDRHRARLQRKRNHSRILSNIEKLQANGIEAIQQDVEVSSEIHSTDALAAEVSEYHGIHIRG